MANASVLRSFLVSLGWDVDTAGMNRFAGSIAVQTEAVRELGEGLKAAALKVAGFVRDVTTGLNKVYITSVQTKSSVGNLQAISFALEQVGQDANAAAPNIRALRNLLLTNPNEESWLGQLHVEARDAKHELRDTSVVYQEMLAAIAKEQNQQPYLNSPFNGGGLDKTLLDAMTSPEFKAAQEDYNKRLKESGVNADDLAKQAHELANALNRVSSEIDILKEAISSGLKAAWDKLSPETQKQIQEFTDLGLQVGRLTYWWNHLSESTKTNIERTAEIVAGLAVLVAGLVALGVIVAAVAAALSALGTVLGLISALFAAITSPIGLVVVALAALAYAFRNKIPWDTIKADWDGFTDRVKKLADTITTYLSPVLGGVGKLLGSIFGHDEHAGGGAKGSPGSGATPGIRNNNPGNMDYTPFTRAHGATGFKTTKKHDFATFATAQDGLNANAALLRDYAARGLDSIRLIMGKYAPPKDKDGHFENDTEQYIAFMAKRMGVSAEEHLNLSDPARLAQIQAAIVQFENGKNPYSQEMYNKAAKQAIGAGAGAGATIHQMINTTVTGAADPQGVSRALDGTLGKSNVLLVGALQGRTS